MKAKPNLKPEFVKTPPLRNKPRLSQGTPSQKPEFLTAFGNDAETIRNEVLRVKEKLKNSSSLFEQLGSHDLLEKKND